MHVMDGLSLNPDIEKDEKTLVIIASDSKEGIEMTHKQLQLSCLAKAVLHGDPDMETLKSKIDIQTLKHIDVYLKHYNGKYDNSINVKFTVQTPLRFVNISKIISNAFDIKYVNGFNLSQIQKIILVC